MSDGWLDATAQAELVRSGEAKPLELVEDAIARIESLNPQLNAVVHTNFERARDAAPADTAWVLAPSHRSYLDFVLCSFLPFARPDLKIALPHIAAAKEFSALSDIS